MFWMASDNQGFYPGSQDLLADDPAYAICWTRSALCTDENSRNFHVKVNDSSFQVGFLTVTVPISPLGETLFRDKNPSYLRDSLLPDLMVTRQDKLYLISECCMLAGKAILLQFYPVSLDVDDWDIYLRD